MQSRQQADARRREYFMNPRGRWTTFRLSRDTILFSSGLIGIGYETVLQGGERPTLLVLFGAMVGLPAFLRSDEAHKGEKNSDQSPAPASESTDK